MVCFQVSSLTTESDSVFIDLLTYADLELLKSRKTGNKPNNSSSIAAKNNRKRYLILTYAVEFDRVHYPLPLNYEDNPDPQDLKLTISRLREEITHMKAHKGGGSGGGAGGGGGGGGGGQAADTGGLDSMRAQLEKQRRAREQAESSLALMRRQHTRTVNDMEEKFEATHAELEQCRNLLDQRHTQASRGESGDVRKLRTKIAELEEEMAMRYVPRASNSTHRPSCFV